MIHFKILELIFPVAIPVIEETALKSGSAGAERVKTVMSIFFLLLIIPLLIALFFIIKSVYRNTIGKKLKTTLIEDYKKEAEEYEKAGRFVSAANVYETELQDLKKAAMLYEKGKDYKKAAEIYELMGMTENEKEMHEKDGDILAAAEVSIREGEYVEAAKLYNMAGDKIKVAEAFEKSGRKLAAVGAYREAGEYGRAAILLEREGMLKEAVEMLGFALHGEKVGASNIDEFYAYASKLAKAGEAKKALEVFKEIERVKPFFKDVRERLQALRASPEDENLEGRITLRSLIRSGKIEPRHSLKLWVHIFKNLQAAYKKGRNYGFLSPDNIAIDSQNNISFSGSTPPSDYVSPETAKEVELDVRADIYSMGFILYEMLTGSLNGLGSSRVVDIVEDVPDWLDEILIKCLRKVREDRYQSIEDILAELKALSRNNPCRP